MRPLASRIARFARERTVLVVSALAALATVPFVPPDEAYLGYFDVKTLACLFGILAVVGALRGIGLFEHAARLIVARFVTAGWPWQRSWGPRSCFRCSPRMTWRSS